MNRRELIASFGAAVATPAALVAAPTQTVTVTICANVGFDEKFAAAIVEAIREAIDRRDVIVLNYSKRA